MAILYERAANASVWSMQLTAAHGLRAYRVAHGKNIALPVPSR
jgi:hypothetical protein